MIVIGDKVRLADKVLTQKHALEERAYSQYMEVTYINMGVATCIPSHVNDVDRQAVLIHMTNLVLVEKAFSWGSPISGNHDPLDYPDQYGDD